MDRFLLRWGRSVLALALTSAMVGCSAHAQDPAPSVVQDESPGAALALPAPVVPLSTLPAPPRASLDVPNTCDQLVLVDVPGQRRPRLSKQLPPWFSDPDKRAAMHAWTRGVIAVVVSELGGDLSALELLDRKAKNESSSNPGSVHAMNGDLAANRRAAEAAREGLSPRWRRATIPVHRRGANGMLDHIDDYDALALGRGLYGQITAYYILRWSANAPPWSLCDPIVATVTMIWSARKGQAVCGSRSLRSAYRWMSAGRCSARSEDKERIWPKLARGRFRGFRMPAIRPDGPVDFGRRWPEATADREVLLARLRARVDAEVGLRPF